MIIKVKVDPEHQDAAIGYEEEFLASVRAVLGHYYDDQQLGMIVEYEARTCSTWVSLVLDGLDVNLGSTHIALARGVNKHAERLHNLILAEHKLTEAQSAVAYLRNA